MCTGSIRTTFLRWLKLSTTATSVQIGVEIGEVRRRFIAALDAFKADVQSAFRARSLPPLLESLRAWFAFDYERNRKADGVATFDDLLVWARDLLLNGGARRYFQSRYTHVLIDEFQDTDPLQAEIGFYLAATADADVGPAVLAYPAAATGRPVRPWAMPSRAFTASAGPIWASRRL